MSCSNQHIRREAPSCPNCGKPDSARMGSTEWGHGYSCCSDRCGKRLAKRIENGMFKAKSPYYVFEPFQYDTTENLRNRIRQLKHQLKNNGIKPVKS